MKTEIFQITEQQLFDYINCPTLFDLKYNKKFQVNDVLTIKNLLYKTSVSYFTYLIMDRHPTLDMLKRKWDTVCEKNEDRFSQDKLLDGMGLLHQFYLWAENENFNVLDLNTKYTIQLKEAEMNGLSGLFISHDNMIELLVPDFSTRQPEQIYIDLKLKYSIDAYIFYRLHNKMISGIRVHHVKSNKDYLSVRTFDDYLRVETTINNVAKGIKQNAFYPREVGCHYCDAVSYCKGWYK